MPANFEYRPLGFEAFAAPLQQMQGYYDATKGAIEDLDFQIQNLPFSTDPEKAKELSDKMVAKRDQLTKELLKTKDYRTAASGIKNIQKSWINDPHRKALEFNYKNWVELNKSQRENIGKPGGLSQHQYEEWKARSIAEFEEKKGTAFTPDGFEGKYNTLGRNVRLADMTDKVRDLKLKVGNMTHAEKRDFLNRIPQAQGDIMNVTTIIEENDPQKIAQKVEEYMMSQPDVVEWAQELGEYKHWTITNASKEKPEIYKNVANSLIDDRINNITGRLTKINELAKEGKIDLKSKEYIEVIDKLKTDKEDLSKMKETEEYNSDIVKELIIQKEMNNVFDADAVGNVLGYKNVTHTRSFSKLPGEGDERETNLKNLLGGGFTTTDYATPNLSTLNKVKSKAAGELYNNIGAINNLAGNKMRSFVMGELDKNGKPTQSRQNLEKNPIKVAAKQRAVASIFTNTYDPKNPEQSLKNFHKEAWKQGFKPDWATSKAVFNSLQGDDGGNFNEMLRESEYTYQTAVDTENIMKLVQKKASDLPEFTKEINEFQSYTTDLTDAEYAKAKKMGIVGQGKNTVWGVPGKYSSNLYVKARVMGYLDLADAYKKGETFKGTSFYDQIGHKYQSNEILNPIVNNLIE
ncbi:MAG: hypothetical protein Q8Q35_02335, partial [Nanoarchaeota archaeon]|nr:hypothetical protein [Nanoarchaeota archaeon]